MEAPVEVSPPLSHSERCLWLAGIFDKPRYHVAMVDGQYRRALVPSMDLDGLIARALRAYAEEGL